MIDLQDKFDELNDLPISEELLGAYAEGNLRGAEYREVQNLVTNDSSLSDLISSVEQDTSYLDLESYNPLSSNMDLIALNDYSALGIEDLELPNISPELFISASPLDCDFTLGFMLDDVEYDSNDIDGNLPIDNDHNDNDSFHSNGMNDNFDY